MAQKMSHQSRNRSPLPSCLSFSSEVGASYQVSFSCLGHFFHHSLIDLCHIWISCSVVKMDLNYLSHLTHLSLHLPLAGPSYHQASQLPWADLSSSSIVLGWSRPYSFDDSYQNPFRRDRLWRSFCIRNQRTSWLWVSGDLTVDSSYHPYPKLVWSYWP